MNVWLTKNIRFGYKYTITKSMRSHINLCLHTWLDDLLSKKSKENDIFVICGGLFSNTTPSLIAIDDAHKFLKKISKKIKVFLVNTDRDIRIFDKETYSTLNIFSDIPNVIISNNIKEFGYTVLIDEIEDMNIPNIMQLDEIENKPGLIVYNTISKKSIMVENSFSPKHITFNINSLEDFSFIDKIKYKNDFIHIQLNNNLLEEKKLEVNIALHNINACSVKYIDNKEFIKEKDIIDITNSLNIVDTIFEHIGEDEKVKKQFEKVLNVFKK